MNTARKALKPYIIIGLIAISSIACFSVAVYYCFLRIGYDFIGMFFGGLGSLILAFTGLWVLSKKKRQTAVILRRILIGILLAGTLLFVVLEIPIIKNARSDTDVEAAYLIVLGAGINGTEPSMILYERLSAALAYLSRFPNSIAVVSGGQGPDEDITEAEAMERWLTRQGIPQERIIQEGKSTSTKENISFSMQKILENGGTTEDKIAIVSNEFHLYRAKYTAKELGIQAVGVAAKTTFPGLKVSYFIREAFAILKLYLS